MFLKCCCHLIIEIFTSIYDCLYEIYFRCGMVYVDADELKWMPYVHKWMHKWSQKLKDEVKTYILELFERYVENGLRFVSKKCTQIINQVRVSELDKGFQVR